MTTTHSRRSILAGFAAVPALSLPALAIDHPDAELLKAGAEFDRTVALFADAQRRSRANWDAWDEARKQLPRPATDADYMAASERVAREYPIAFPTCDDCAAMMDEPIARISRLPAHTPQGLAVKARVVRWHASKIWDKSADENDLDEQALRSLCEAVEAMAVQS